MTFTLVGLDVYDARVFVNSSLYKRGQEEILLPNGKDNINGKEIPLVLLGDPAYPLLTWLMKPYSDNGHLTHYQKRFNYRLSRARAVVEHAYGRLKGRWRCLLKKLDISIDFVPDLVAVCCVSHNICEVNGEAFNMELLQRVERDEVHCSDVSETILPAENIRQTLSNYFKNSEQ